MAVLIGSARSDERGKTTGGQAGDQKNGKEVSTQSWYKHRLGWRVFRCKDPEKAAVMAQVMRSLCDTGLLGYDQGQRDTLYNALSAVGWQPEALAKAVETDCSALIRVCAACAGILLPDFNTASEANVLLASGAFAELTGSRYTGQSLYLGEGDVLVTRSKGHTVMVLTDGAKFEGVVQPREYVLGVDVLNVDTPKCDAVAVMQEYLIQLGYDLGKWGADGDFGDCTELAVIAFQKEHGCRPIDGEYGPVTHAALTAALEAQQETGGRIVTIGGGQCWVRSAPDTSGEKLGVAGRDSRWTYGGETAENGWLCIDYNGQTGWVSGLYGKTA